MRLGSRCDNNLSEMTRSSYLTPYQVDALVSQLQCIPLDQVAMDQWMKQHDFFIQLNQQAHLDAVHRHDELVLESIVSHDQMQTLLYDLLVSETWKDHVFPLVLPQLPSICHIKMYTIVRFRVEILLFQAVWS